MLKDRMKWPGQADCGAMISVILEAAYFAKMYYPDEEIDLTGGEAASLGKEGMEFGLPKILDVLDAYQAKATFFILGAVADQYPEAVKEIAARGHEIGCHGYYHENLGRLPIEEQRQVLKSAKEKLEAVSGKQVKGFRMPEGEMTEETLCVAKELGFLYSTSLSDDDIPYRREKSQIVELPIHWELYDLPYFVYTWEPQIPQGQGRTANVNDVLENWNIELDGALQFGTLFQPQIDPQATGEQGRIFLLETLMDRMTSDDRIWLATGEEIAAYFTEIE